MSLQLTPRLGDLAPITPYITYSMPTWEGPERIFGKQYDPEATKLYNQDLQLRIDNNLDITRQGAGILVDGEFPQIRVGPLDAMLTQTQPAIYAGLDWFPRAETMPDVVNEARQVAAQEELQQNTVWQFNQFINSQPLIAVAAIIGVYFLAKRVTR